MRKNTVVSVVELLGIEEILENQRDFAQTTVKREPFIGQIRGQEPRELALHRHKEVRVGAIGSFYGNIQFYRVIPEFLSGGTLGRNVQSAVILVHGNEIYWRIRVRELVEGDKRVDFLEKPVKSRRKQEKLTIFNTGIDAVNIGL